jgi:hypothetical protein
VTRAIFTFAATVLLLLALVAIYELRHDGISWTFDGTRHTLMIGDAR